MPSEHITLTADRATNEAATVERVTLQSGADTRFIQPAAHVLANGRSAMVVRRYAGRVRVQFLDGSQGVYALAEIKHPLSSSSNPKQE